MGFFFGEWMGWNALCRVVMWVCHEPLLPYYHAAVNGSKNGTLVDEICLFCGAPYTEQMLFRGKTE